LIIYKPMCHCCEGI